MFISCLDAKETEPKKKSRLHFVGGLFPSFTKASELASLKQPMLLNVLSVKKLFRLQDEAIFIHLQFTIYKVQIKDISV